MHFCSTKHIEILAIQEHRIHYKEEVNYCIQKLGSWYFIYSSADEHAIGGVGFLVSSRVFTLIEAINLISLRILSISLVPGCHFTSTFLSVYSPTSEADLPTINTFYDDLTTYYSTIHLARDFPIICGDFNATLTSASHSILFSPNETSNRNADLFHELCYWGEYR